MTNKVTEKRRIMIVDDHQLFREGLSQMINREPHLVVCGEAQGVEEALNRIPELKPELIIVDISLGQSNGLELIKQLKNDFESIPALVISMHDDSLYAERAIWAGARGYVNKQEANKKVKEAIARVLNGEIFLSEKIASTLVAKLINGKRDPAKSPVDRLSVREVEVFGLIGKGMTTKEIADHLKLSTATINSFRSRIKEKLDIRSIPELVLQAAQFTRESL